MLGLLAGAVAGTVAIPVPGQAQSPATHAGDGLAALAERSGILYGAALSNAALDVPEEAALYRRETRLVTVDPDLLLPFLRPTADRFETAGAERIIAFARENGMQVRGHALIWNDNVPDWLRRLSRREIAGWFDRHIDQTAAHFRGRLHSWDVVNEPIFPVQRNRHGMRSGPWLDALGPDYVARAFKRAAAADPTCRLVLNEAFTERADDLGRSVRHDLLPLLDRVRDSGARIDAIGLQGHIDAHIPFDVGAYSELLWQLHGRGFDIYITELDAIDLELEAVNASERDRIVAERYAALLKAALAVPSVKVIVTWQLADHRSWLRNPWFVNQFPPRRRRFPSRPLPFDAQLQRKPAYDAIAGALRARPK